MLSKTRTTIAILGAALTIIATTAISSLGPIVPNAYAEAPCYKIVGCPKSWDEKKSKCAALNALFSSDALANEAAAKEGNMAAATEAAENMENDVRYGQEYGCDWAARVKLPLKPLPTSGVVAPVGATQGSPATTTLTPIRGVKATSSPPSAR